jgi:cell division protein FtsQ
MRGSIRLVAWCLAIALVVLPIVGVLCGWFAADRWPVTQLTVQAEFKHVSAEQIRAAVRPRLGKGFFALNLDAVQSAVAALPWVESVEASKRWPDTLLLRVYERQPFARWNSNQLISGEGKVFTVPDAADYNQLPDLRGPDDHLAEVISFFADVQKAFTGTHLKITGVTLTDRGSWSVSTDTGAQIVIGDRNQAGHRLHRFLDVYAQVMAGHDQGFEYADLRYTNGFAVKWPQAPAAPTAPTAGGTPRT